MFPYWFSKSSIGVHRKTGILPVFLFPTPLKYRHFPRNANQENHVFVTRSGPPVAVLLRAAHVAKALFLAIPPKRLEDNQWLLQHVASRKQFVKFVLRPMCLQVCHSLDGDLAFAFLAPERDQSFDKLKPLFRSHRMGPAVHMMFGSAFSTS